jgi:arginyl-tRNA--protein-N-Asp/Glu arginylyltransferase
MLIYVSAFSAFVGYNYILIAYHKFNGPLADLLDMGWRRSGSFLYKPEMERTCCPSYTIRLRAADFIHSKEQLRVSRRMQRYSKFWMLSHLQLNSFYYLVFYNLGPFFMICFN